jgi:hypothetical protein
MMATTANTRPSYLPLVGYLVVSLAAATLAMSRFAGSTDEVFAFGAMVWAIPAVIALVSHKRGSVTDRFRNSAIWLVIIVALSWTALFLFEATY